MTSWSWQITDSGFTPIGELQNARELKLSLPLNKISLASFKIRMDNPLAQPLSTAACYVKAYRNKQLMFFGPVVNAQEVSEGSTATIKVNAAGPEWIFGYRLTGKSAEGVKFLTVGQSNSEHWKSLMDEMNEEGETHIESGSMSGGSEVGYEAPPFKKCSEVLADFSNTSEGFDWTIEPIDNLVEGYVSGQKIGLMEISPKLGTLQENSVFEWGTGRRNVAQFSKLADRTTQLNRAWNITSAGPDATGAPTLKAEDLESIAQWGLMEDMVNASILNQELRQILVNENRTVRKNPRQTIAFQPVNDDGTGRVPQIGKDYFVGDSVPLRVAYNGVAHFNVETRIWAADFSFDENLKETQTLTTSPQ